MNIIQPKFCEFCGKEYFPDKKNYKKQRYCSHLCQTKGRWREVKTPQILASIRERVCKKCGKVFMPNIKNHIKQIFCSKKCQAYSSSRKQDEEMKSLRKNPEKNPNRFIFLKEAKQVYHNNQFALMRYFYREMMERRDEVGSIFAKDWRDIKEKYGHKCSICGKEETAREMLTIDHIIPISSKGKNAKDNIRPLCSKCNTNKSKMDSIHTPSIPN